MMVHAAADDVRFLPYIFHKMMEKLNESSLWKLAVRGALYCRCFCVNNIGYADWPPIPSVPGFLVISTLFTTTHNDLLAQSISIDVDCLEWRL